MTGIGAVRAKRITNAWAEQKIVREIMVFLHSNGVGTARAVRIFKTYGADAVQVMTENSDGAVIADEVDETVCTFLAGLYRAEQTIAERLIRIVSGRMPWPWD